MMGCDKEWVLPSRWRRRGELALPSRLGAGRSHPFPSRKLVFPHGAIRQFPFLSFSTRHLCLSFLLVVSGGCLSVGRERFVNLSRDPQAVQQHGQLPGHSHHRLPLGSLSPALRKLESPLPQC